MILLLNLMNNLYLTDVTTLVSHVMVHHIRTARIA
jgi:hypothetical protein